MTTACYRLDRIHCSGSPEQLGHAQGEALREPIQRFVQQRFDALAVYMGERGSSEIDRFLAMGRQCLEVAASWDAPGTRELEAIARAADVDPVRLYAAGNMTDVRDIVLLPTPSDSSEVDEGCSALIMPAELGEDSMLHAAQTWDLNPTDIDFVVAVHRRPDNGPETWSVTCVGCLSLMGMNDTGLSVGTTNIKARDTQPGVGYLSLLHRALNCSTLEQAVHSIETAPRAAAHTYWLADASGAVELECSARLALKRRLESKALTRTNHCLASELLDLQGEPTSPSSDQRLKRLDERLAEPNQSVASLRRLFEDRSDGLLSINRYIEDETGTSTNACMIAVPARRTLWACRGPADRGEWVRLEFDEQH